MGSHEWNVMNGISCTQHQDLINGIS